MYTLQILHTSDLEGGVDAIDDAPNFAVVVDALEAEAEAEDYGSVLISAGDNFILGPFFSAGGDFGLADTYEGFYNAFFGLIDTDALTGSADTDGDGFFDNDEIEVAIASDAALGVGDVYTTDLNGDGFVDFFEEIDTAGGRLDIAIMNALGFDASAVGNHEFDGGTGAFEDAINYDSEEGNALSAGRYGNPNFLQEVDTPGAQFPYLSANLDFSGDGAVGELFTSLLLRANAFDSDLSGARVDPDDPATTGPDANDPKIAEATIIEEDGELVGVVGATTQLVESLSSTGGVEVVGPDRNDMAALAAILQPVIDDVIDGDDNVAGTGDDVNKVILTAHLQQFSLGVELAGLLTGVDVVLSGGSDTISADDGDLLRPGDMAEQPYPVFVTGAGGEPVAVVSTDGEYSYVGRLVVTFDDDGVVLPDSVDADVSGAFGTHEDGVLAMTGAASLAEAIAASESATDVQNLTEAVTEIVVALDGDIAGETDVFLNGQREDVRTQETNLGNLTADANLDAAREIDPMVQVSLKNGGGIRASIGEIVVEDDGEVEFVAPQANPVSGREAGEISELAIDNALRFDNGLVAITLTPRQLLIVLEHAVAETGEGATPGQFAQVGGLKFSFDPDGMAQQLDGGAVVVEGERVQSVALLGEDGEDTLIVQNGEVLPDAPEAIRVVTLNFLLDGGDGYPYPAFIDADPDFADVADLGIGEQAALSEFLGENFPPDGDMDFSQQDTPVALDTRIQNLNERQDTLDDNATPRPSGALSFEVVAELEGEGGEGASEVVAHEDGRLYVTNGALGRIDIFDIAAEELASSIDLTGLDGFDGVQSVDVANGVVAAAIARAPEPIFFGNALISQPGFVAFFDADSGALLSRVDVGNLPDDVTFTPGGNTLVVAGEGEKNADSDHDDNPPGTVTIIDVSQPAAPTVQILDFKRFNGFEEVARQAGIRIQEGVSFAADVEPEYVAISPDGTSAYVSLQENNAIAQIDLATARVIDILPLGSVDFGSESALDPLDDGEIDIRQFENLVGLRMPDAIATFETGGVTYIATANEGDSRDFDEARVGDLAADGLLDPGLVAELEAGGLIDDDPDTDIGLERLEVSTIDGDTDGDGDIDTLTAFSSRSFSIFDEDGKLVFDSGSDFERIVAELAPERFNDDDGTDDENRSDAKGPEPEAIAIGQVGEQIFAFIGLERDSGIVIYEVTDPASARFVDYIPPKFTGLTPEDAVARQGPEVITFVPADESTTGKAQIAVAYEISGTTIVYDLSLSAGGEITSIPQIQGAGHLSPHAGETVTTTGIVTAVDFNGYYLQDPFGDGDAATSDAIFVFTDRGLDSPVAVGDEVRITGEVQEFIPGGADTGNLSITEILAADATILSTGNPLPEATIIGMAGRVPPDQIVISDDELPVNLQVSSGAFDPEEDGIDFYESLEAMRVTVDDPVTISATNRFDETWVVADDGAGASPPLTDRGTLLLEADMDGRGDLNPERIQLQYDNFLDLLPDDFDPPELAVAANLSNVTGVVSYGFGNFEVLVTEPFAVEEPSPLEQEVTAIEGGQNRLTVATYNLLNVTAAPSDDDADQIAAIAQQIVGNLGAPDILGLQEIQDDSGEADDGVLSADQTLQALVDAIEAAGGPSYSFKSAAVDEDGETGGVPGGNIRNAYLWNPDRVEADAFVTLESDQLATIGVDNPDAFEGTRDPLLGVFEFNGEEVILINNHFSSRFGSEPIFGGPQPFLQAGEAEREAQAKALNEVVDALVSMNEDARVAVLGDFNTFEFTDELLEDLPGLAQERVLTNLIDDVPDADAYTFNFQGNSQVLDHIFVTDSLLEGARADIVHTNVDFVDPASDHEPVVASLVIGEEPVEGVVLIGDGEDNRLVGGAGDDQLSGLSGRDLLLGRGGNDVLIGGRGSDVLAGGADDDLLRGGLEPDTFVFGQLFGDDRLVDFNAGADMLFFLGTAPDEIDVKPGADGVVLSVDNADSTGSVTLVGIDGFDPDQSVLVL